MIINLIHVPASRHVARIWDSVQNLTPTCSHEELCFCHLVSGREKTKKHQIILVCLLRTWNVIQKWQVKSNVLLVLYTDSNDDENWRLREECKRGQAIVVFSPNTFSAFTLFKVRNFLSLTRVCWPSVGFSNLFSLPWNLYTLSGSTIPLSRNSACEEPLPSVYFEFASYYCYLTSPSPTIKSWHKCEVTGPAMISFVWKDGSECQFRSIFASQILRVLAIFFSFQICFGVLFWNIPSPNKPYA